MTLHFMLEQSSKLMSALLNSAQERPFRFRPICRRSEMCLLPNIDHDPVPSGREMPSKVPHIGHMLGLRLPCVVDGFHYEFVPAVGNR